ERRSLARARHTIPPGQTLPARRPAAGRRPGLLGRDPLGAVLRLPLVRPAQPAALGGDLLAPPPRIGGRGRLAPTLAGLPRAARRRRYAGLVTGFRGPRAERAGRYTCRAAEGRKRPQRVLAADGGPVPCADLFLHRYRRCAGGPG